MESCWRVVGTDQKEQIVKELLNQQLKLTKDFYGSKVLKTCAVLKACHSYKNAQDIQDKANRKRQSFEETLNSVETKKKKKKKKQSEEQTREDTLDRKYAKEMAVLGFGQQDDDNNNNDNHTKVS